MNHIYKTIWNTTTGIWTVVQETAKSRGKSASSGAGGVGAAILEGLGIKKAQRFVPAVMASALTLAANHANAEAGLYFNDGRDIN